MSTKAVVVGSDGSAIGDAVVRQGAVLARSMGASLHLVAAEAHWDRGARAAGEWDVKAHLHAARGDLMQSVWAVAERVGADQVVIDRTGRSALRRRLSTIHWRLAPATPRTVAVIDTSARESTLIDSAA